MQADVADRTARLRTDPVLESRVLTQRRKRQASEEEITRRMSNPAG